MNVLFSLPGLKFAVDSNIVQRESECEAKLQALPLLKAGIPDVAFVNGGICCFAFVNGSASWVALAFYKKKLRFGCAYQDRGLQNCFIIEQV